MTGTAPPETGRLPIDSPMYGRREQPETPEAVAELLRACSLQDEGVYPVGGGTHGRVGLAADPAGVALSLRGLSGVLRYDPDDLVVSVGAGTTLAELAVVLAERGQWLPVEAPGGPNATVGGVLALGLNGPRSLGSPSLRDLLIGMRVAGTDGTVASSGGMVVKNVSGLDMGRLHVGARGTLGVITSANFKVWPIPETEATVLARYPAGREELADALGRARALRTSMLRPVAADVVAGEGTICLAIRFEGRAAGVRRQVDDARALFRRAAEVIEADVSAAWWADHVGRLNFQADDVTAIRLDGRPRDAEAIGTAAWDAATAAGATDWRLSMSPGLGQAWVHLRGASVGISSDLVSALAGAPAGIGLVAGSAEFRSAYAGHRPAEVREVDRALRQQFDPAGILNRGRWPLP